MRDTASQTPVTVLKLEAGNFLIQTGDKVTIIRFLLS
jgi:hypothetical protein